MEGRPRRRDSSKSAPWTVLHPTTWQGSGNFLQIVPLLPTVIFMRVLLLGGPPLLWEARTGACGEGARDVCWLAIWTQHVARSRWFVHTKT